MYLGDALGTESHVCLAIMDSAENFRLLNRNGSADRRLLHILLRDQNGQHAGFVLRLDFLRLHIADIKAAGAGAGITLLTQDTTLLAFFVFILFEEKGLDFFLRPLDLSESEE